MGYRDGLLAWTSTIEGSNRPRHGGPAYRMVLNSSPAGMRNLKNVSALRARPRTRMLMLRFGEHTLHRLVQMQGAGGGRGTWIRLPRYGDREP